jgi:outer membrane autotransporter protein
LPEPGTNPSGWWIGSIFDVGQTEQIGDYNGFDSDVSAATIGIDKRLSDDTIFGGAVSFTNTSVDQNGYRKGDEASISGTHLSLYGAFDVTPDLFLGVTITGSQLRTDSNRSTIIGRLANAKFDSTQLTGKVDLGYRIKLGNSGITLTPLAHLEHSRLNQDAYTETGAGDVGYKVDSETFTRNEASLGFRIAGVSSVGGVVVKPEFTLLSTMIGGNFSQNVRASFIGDNSSSAKFETTALDEKSYDNVGYKASLGLGLLLSDTSSIDVRVEHKNFDDRTNSKIDLKVRWDF